MTGTAASTVTEEQQRMSTPVPATDGRGKPPHGFRLGPWLVEPSLNRISSEVGRSARRRQGDGSPRRARVATESTRHQGTVARARLARRRRRRRRRQALHCAAARGARRRCARAALHRDDRAQGLPAARRGRAARGGSLAARTDSRANDRTQRCATAQHAHESSAARRCHCRCSRHARRCVAARAAWRRCSRRECQTPLPSP